MSSDTQPCFTLYLAGEAPAEAVLEAIRQAMQALVDGVYDLDVVNVLEHAEEADAEGVFCTPTLVININGMECRLIGGLVRGERARILDTAQRETGHGETE
ncbi:MAG: hypothetical protein B0D96_11645 [Candidatus Sedimenticola endophacoides]|nr:MAG: hypothetical protein B0D94_12635 [Candidatus Sedimenticola endophacoides]OQX33428.1 MAG: hypothetical protein B0D96_11645 [Candidatus Sedimenticola endophacoides]OQX42303.1 MAG: hypothetical protein B0D89_01520 [Candidatus Sedimenticola endophacoides]OQX45206.1 MAG: hypothetical protein B0D88_00890 [Candidatus Sedimenticola endophacoides]OQX47289.1 MAG: hypothetical protein B0D86_00250 [Candidatus Sedimenticola endophacoides]